MTEKKAIEVLKRKYMPRYMCLNSGECKRHNKAISKAISALEEIQQYRALGTVKELREAMEKQRAKKPVTYLETNRADCPVCGSTVRGIDKPFGDYCSRCGQKLDWSEEE